MELKNAMFCWKVLGWIAMLVVVLCIVGGVAAALVFYRHGGLNWLLLSLGAAFGVAIGFGLVPWTVYAVLDQLRQQTAALQALTWRPLSEQPMPEPEPDPEPEHVEPQPIRIGRVTL
jgi:hypothetical protein